MLLKEENQSAQVTIFVIIAIVLIAAVVIFFVVRGNVSSEKIPASIGPVYTDFLFCLEDTTLMGIKILESQAGYISLPEFEPGSSYMPFSNQLDFVGTPVPYWYYVSQNNIQKEQVPSKRIMEQELKNLIEEKAKNCEFENYYGRGFEIEQGVPIVSVSIKDSEVDVNLDMNFAVRFENDTAEMKNHNVVVKSKLGKLYSSAKEIYDKEQKELFLENYGLNTLELYAPVDGVEITCSPKVWFGDDVFNELEDAIQANTLALKTKGGDYTLNAEENKYFVIESSVNARFINSKNWPHSFEVTPSDGNVLISMPVGNQPGLGILGFCYVPYHFVYSLKYPILVQVQEGEEIFQFPIAVVIQRNEPREALASSVEIGVPELCKYKNNLVGVEVYDSELNPINADIFYNCFGESCEIGKTSSGYLEGEFPQCVNGDIIAKAEGFDDGKEIYSSAETGSVVIVLNKLYQKQINLKVDGLDSNKEAVISFVSDNDVKTLVYPVQKIIELSDNNYFVQVYLYENSSLNFESTTSQQCVEVPVSGVGGLFGFTKEKCFEIQIPEQIISSVLSGGGKGEVYLSEYELKNSNIIDVSVESLPLPTSIDQLQENYLLFKDKEADIVLR